MTDTKRVGREPTPEMLSHASLLYAPIDCKSKRELDHARAEIWRAMFDAAPREPDKARELLRDCDAALLSWMHTYADDVASADEVAVALARIDGGGGTLAYIARLRERIDAYLAAQDQPQAEPRCCCTLSNAVNGIEADDCPLHGPIPAAEPDAERARAWQCVEDICEAVRYTNRDFDALRHLVAAALRTYGEECRAAERAKWERGTKR